MYHYPYPIPNLLDLPYSKAPLPLILILFPLTEYDEPGLTENSIKSLRKGK